jgi:hypothetical protein
VPVVPIERRVVGVTSGTALRRTAVDRLDEEVLHVETVVIGRHTENLCVEVHLVRLACIRAVVLHGSDANLTGLVPLCAIPPHIARFHPNNMWVRVGNVHDNAALKIVRICRSSCSRESVCVRVNMRSRQAQHTEKRICRHST